MKARTVAYFGLLTAMALVLGYVEHLLPIAPGIPGVKLGLANTVLLYAVYLMGPGSAFVLMALKVVLSGLLFSGVTPMLYSLAGGVLSLVFMLLAKKIPLFTSVRGNKYGSARGKVFSAVFNAVSAVGVVIVSAVGAVFHNIGQLAVAALMVNTRAVMLYAPVLLVAGVITGILTGTVARLVLGHLKVTEQHKQQAAGDADETN